MVPQKVDAAARASVIAGTTTATSSDSGTTWTASGTTTNHYADDTDSPTWTPESSSAITRNVTDLTGGLTATTSASGSTALQLADLHGNIGVKITVATGAAEAYNYDEYGNTTSTVRYGWLGVTQRASDTPTGLTIMGLRLYNPTTGRFLQTDPVPGASANAYDYCNGDPVNCTDLNGQCPSAFRHPVSATLCEAAVGLTEYGLEVAGEALCGAFASAVLPLCSGIVTGLTNAGSYYVESIWDGGFSWEMAIQKFVVGAIAGGIGGAFAKKFFRTSVGKTFMQKFRRLLVKLGASIDAGVRRATGKTIHITRLMAKISVKLGKLAK